MGTLTFNGRTLVMETETIDVTSSMPRRDPDWVFTDAAGHVHRWVDADVPTARWVADGEVYWCEDCNETHEDDDGHWACRECGEEVEPGMRGPSLYREFVKGLTTATIDGEFVTREQADVFMAEVEAARNTARNDQGIDQTASGATG